ncbi:HvfX family Cu-binding RiPP maturation protein [Elizabethkingia anophelis]|uniref:HvfX family Cu-binding RiPP maturation protein n=1 Tax=Elizabethkingia anophelis TaxID=1117645 RepID=UPI0013679F89|nr:DoxX family protein [Elizabethkingia anophelis]
MKNNIKDVPFLLMRCIMAYGFFNAGIMKYLDIKGNSDWFKSIGLPFPIFNTWLSGGIEMFGAVMLCLGFMTRIVSISLIFIMCIAIFTVHLYNGFFASNDGFEINLYYIIMLLTLLVQGAGIYSLDYRIKTKKST